MYNWGMTVDYMTNRGLILLSGPTGYMHHSEHLQPHSRSKTALIGLIQVEKMASRWWPSCPNTVALGEGNFFYYCVVVGKVSHSEETSAQLMAKCITYILYGIHVVVFLTFQDDRGFNTLREFNFHFGNDERGKLKCSGKGAAKEHLLPTTKSFWKCPLPTYALKRRSRGWEPCIWLAPLGLFRIYATGKRVFKNVHVYAFQSLVSNISSNMSTIPACISLIVQNI